MKQRAFYNTAAQEVCELFAAHIEGDATRPFLVISSCGIHDATRTAIEKTLLTFGYQTPAWSHAQLAPAHTDSVLDEHAALLLIEGIDPLRIICTDSSALKTLASAYHMPLAPNSTVRLWGRTAAIFANLDVLISTDAGKRTAWGLLKLLK